MRKYRVKRIVTEECVVDASNEEWAVHRAFVNPCLDTVRARKTDLNYDIEEIPPVIRYDGIIRIEGGFSRSGPFWESVKLDIESELQAMVDRLNEGVYEEFGFQVGEIEPTSEEVVE